MDLDTLRGRLSYQGLLLGVAALATSGLLALASRATGPAIKAAEARDLMVSLSRVVPSGFDNDLLHDSVAIPDAAGPVTVYRARRDDHLTALVFKVIGHGYAGEIVALLSVDPEGRVLGVSILKHSETPGLGDKIEPEKTDWIHGFEGKSLGDPKAERWAVKKDGGVFDQFSGATITPRGVVRAIKGGLEFFARERGKLLDSPGSGPIAARAP